VKLLEDGHIVTPGRLNRRATIVHDAVIRVYDEAGTVIETHQHKGDSRNVIGRLNPVTVPIIVGFSYGY
jgi:hypothetical protein